MSSFFLIIHRTLRHAQEGSTLSKSPQPDFKGKGAEQDVPKGLTSAPFLQSIVLSFILSEETPICVFHFHCESRKCLIKIKLNLLCFLFTQKSHQLPRGRICKFWHPNLLTRLRDRADRAARTMPEALGHSNKHSCTPARPELGACWGNSTQTIALGLILPSFVESDRK